MAPGAMRERDDKRTAERCGCVPTQSVGTRALIPKVVNAGLRLLTECLMIEALHGDCIVGSAGSRNQLCIAIKAASCACRASCRWWKSSGTNPKYISVSTRNG